MRNKEELQNKEKVIENIIENFNFVKVHKVMESLDWVYSGEEEPPTVGRLVLSMQETLDTIWKMLDTRNNYKISSGGFFYFGEVFEDKKYIEVVFAVTSWDNYE